MPPLETVALIFAALSVGAFVVLAIELYNAPIMRDEDDDDME